VATWDEIDESTPSAVDGGGAELFDLPVLRDIKSGVDEGPENGHRNQEQGGVQDIKHQQQLLQNIRSYIGTSKEETRPLLKFNLNMFTSSKSSKNRVPPKSPLFQCFG